MTSIFTAPWRLAVLAALVLLAAALPAAADAGGGGHGGCARPLSSGAGVEVTIDQICFDPTVAYVALGDTVTWTNEDPVPHTVTGAQGSWGSKVTLSNGATVSHTFDEAGVYPYYCAFHMGQMGVVVVDNDGAGAESGAGETSAMNAADAATADPATADGGRGLGSLVALLAVGGAVAMAGGVAYRSRRR